MKSSVKKKEPEVVLKRGKPVSVILDIKQYEDMLERLEDIDDLKYIESLKKRKLKFHTLDEILRERKTGV